MSSKKEKYVSETYEEKKEAKEFPCDVTTPNREPKFKKNVPDQLVLQDFHSPKSLSDSIIKLSKRDSIINLLSNDEKVEEMVRPNLLNVNNRLIQLMKTYLPNDVDSIVKSIGRHLEYTLATNRFRLNIRNCYLAASLTVRDRILEVWNDTQIVISEQNPKRSYYLSIEYLLGRVFRNGLKNSGLEDQMKKALVEIGMNVEEVYDHEADAGLGNGGLGRLAACYLDSMSTLNYPSWGYGIRYNFGIFQQKILQGNQVEIPDYWLANKNPWEIEREDISYQVKFYGDVKNSTKHGKPIRVWENYQTVLATAFDNPIPGYNTNNTINLRLWKSVPDEELDFKKFDQGDYYGSIAQKEEAEIITSVLYPNDTTRAGKELRLKQQYFFSCASLQDIIRRFKKKNKFMENFPSKVTIQLNDTHPSVSIVELLRILVDEEGFDFDKSWGIVSKVFNYTNHTILPEALEKWPIDLFGNLLPRHLELVYQINEMWLNKVREHYPHDSEKLSRLSLIEESTPKMIRMSHLSIIASQKVNGVAKIHSQILKDSLFKDFADLDKDKFINVTNGVTPRRWVLAANERLAECLTQLLGSDEWVNNFEILKTIKHRSKDPELQKHFETIKKFNKRRFAEWLHRKYRVKIDPNSLFDVMIKRIHEYKRQFMFCFYILHRYLSLKKMSFERREKVQKRTFIIAGKSAPGYFIAKRVIKFANSIVDLLDSDPETSEYLKMVFVPNYCVSTAEILIPASDISEHISVAGTEASGTSNMKFVFNGGLILGTLDGANIEIRDEIGDENIFIFGTTVDRVEQERKRMHESSYEEYMPAELREIISEVKNGLLGDPFEFEFLLNSICQKNDRYLIGADFAEYIKAQDRIDEAYSNKQTWNEKCINATFSMGYFSSDRSIKEYATKIWEIDGVRIPSQLDF